MEPLQNKLITLAHVPVNLPVASDFAIKSTPVTAPELGQVLCETQYLSLDPYMRSQISGRHISGTIKPGDTMLGETVSKVIKSTVKGFTVGDKVLCFGGWQKYSTHQPSELTLLPESNLPYSNFLSVLGTTGLTAFAGVFWKAQVKIGDVIVIPAATGGVGATASQLAKLLGCRVIGIAGSEHKCKVAVEKLGYDACINRTDGDIAKQLKKLCPQGVDIYFDLVGGEILNIVSEQLAIGARIILCGIMSELNGQTRSGGPHPAMWIKSRATVSGLVVYDFEERRDEFIQESMLYILQGKLKSYEDITVGIEHAAEAFCRIMRGQNNGKVIVKVH